MAGIELFDHYLNCLRDGTLVNYTLFPVTHFPFDLPLECSSALRLFYCYYLNCYLNCCLNCYGEYYYDSSYDDYFVSFLF